MSILAYVEDLAALGYDPIPIAPGTKDPVSKLTGWQRRPPAELWRHENVTANCNIALRHGGDLQLASVEAEHTATPEQVASLRRYMAGLGLWPDGCPVVDSWQGFPRWFFHLLDSPMTGNSREMAADVGAGELRYGPGAFALIPPSRIDDRPYALVAGDWRQLPPVYWADVAPLLADPRRRDDAPAIDAKLSALAQAIADGENVLPADVRKRLRGMGGTDYPSVDDFTTVYRLAALGFDADSCLAVMLFHPGFGHFSDLAAKNSAAAVHWLADAHAKASAYIAKNGADVSQRLARLIAQTESEAWPGRTGATDKAVYLAHLRIALDANTPVWAGAARRLADLVNVNNVTASHATKRLIDLGRLTLHKAATAQLAAEYALPDEERAHTSPLLYVPTKRSGEVCANSADDESQESEKRGGGGESQRPSEPQTGGVQKILGHDLFSWHGLYKGAGLVYAALPGTVEELAERSGRHRATVKRALAKLAAIRNAVTGEVYALVEQDGAGVWQLVEGADVDKAARLLAVDGIGAKRRAKHEAERQRHAAALDAHRGEVVPHPSQNRGDTSMGQAEVGRKARRQTHREHTGSPEADEFRLQAEAMMP